MELLVVIVLLGFLIAMGMASFKSSQTKSRDSRRKSDLGHIMVALEAYHNDRGRYPLASPDTEGKLMGCAAAGAEECTWNGQFSDSVGTIYMVSLSKDPSIGRRYYYAAAGNGTWYQLYARLENTEDANVVQTGGAPGKYSGVWCDDSHTIMCNYGIASSNRTADTGRTVIAE